MSLCSQSSPSGHVLSHGADVRSAKRTIGGFLKRCARVFVGALLSAAAFAAQAAITYSFGCITFDSSANCGTGSTQLELTVADGGSGTVNFLFTNTGPKASSITDIYFDWKDSGLALGEGALTQSAGVSFGWGATPANLPGGNSIAFSSDLGLDSNVPTQPSGINPGEWLNIAFAGSFDQLAQGIHSSELQVGLHVQGFANGGSAGFVSVPEPTVPAMLLLGFALMRLFVRRRQPARVSIKRA